MAELCLVRCYRMHDKLHYRCCTLAASFWHVISAGVDVSLLAEGVFLDFPLLGARGFNPNPIPWRCLTEARRWRFLFSRKTVLRFQFPDQRSCLLYLPEKAFAELLKFASPSPDVTRRT